MNLPLRLKYATSQAFDVAGLPQSYTYVRVKVQNLAFAKDVVIHHRLPDGSWADESIEWLAYFGNYDVFGHSGLYSEEFVIRYTVNGQTFWDNNDGQNYRLTNFTNVVGGNVILSQATAKRGTQVGGGFTFTTSWVEGAIYVNNLSFAKQVGIRLSSDGGASWQDTDAVYAGAVGEGTFASSAGAERWTFKTPELNINPAADTFRFAVYYENKQTGERFWDNNFRDDYTLSKADGATIE